MAKIFHVTRIKVRMIVIIETKESFPCVEISLEYETT
jgi:hypothetical protein